MPRIFTTSTAENAAKAWLHDIMLVANILTNNQRTVNRCLFNSFQRQLAPDAKKICDELINREFNNIDSSLRVCSNYYFYPQLTDTCNSRTYTAEKAAKALVYMAECLNLYWDDTLRTPYEIDEFKKTILGDAVYKYGRYISAIKDKTSSNTTKARSSNDGTSTTRTSQPKNDYKQSGPQSGNVRDLLGNPGEKVLADTSISYKIIGDKIGQSTPNVFIKPLNPNGAAGSTNKVYVGSGKGYGECTCFFDDPNMAQHFLTELQAKCNIPTNITNLHVAKVHSDPNGYFLVGTELGPCAISAAKLNEALTEDTATNTGGWEKATEGYSKEELEELHTWMRRG